MLRKTVACHAPQELAIKPEVIFEDEFQQGVCRVPQDTINRWGVKLAALSALPMRPRAEELRLALRANQEPYLLTVKLVAVCALLDTSLICITLALVSLAPRAVSNQLLGKKIV
eukprot:TRINITY_DN13977_c0_g1_i1.p2 TRINITY_DN13977_c0_g1~~TRINITY_DN13977_c0_g1_i1.p2  ORF type:complete len:114 (+),score=9.71 TRINITY_DN13977_c0_g1_i1:572-913(+)